MKRQNELLFREMLAYASVVVVGALEKSVDIISAGLALAVVSLTFDGLKRVARRWVSRRQRA